MVTDNSEFGFRDISADELQAVDGGWFMVFAAYASDAQKKLDSTNEAIVRNWAG